MWERLANVYREKKVILVLQTILESSKESAGYPQERMPSMRSEGQCSPTQYLRSITFLRSPTLPLAGRSSAASSAGPCLVQRTGSPALMAIRLLLNDLRAKCFSVASYVPSSCDARSTFFPRCPAYNGYQYLPGVTVQLM